MADKIYAADFENTVDENSVKNCETRVWCAGIISIHDDEDKIKIFNNIDDWIEYIKTLPKGSKIYFHNANYDISFILYYLHKNNYKYCDMIVKTGMPTQKNGYSIIGTPEGNYYQLSINFGSTYVLIRDSLKLVVGKLSKIAKDLKVDEKYWKIEEPQDFYTKERLEGHILTDEEIKYMTNDVMSLAKIMCQLEDIGMTNKLTAASYALYELKKCIHHRYHPDDDETLPWYNKMIKSTFRCFFPLLDDSVDAFCRKSYKGGWCYVKAENTIQEGKHYVMDVNSMYPAMLKGFTTPDGQTYGGVYPTGKPEEFEGYIPDKGLYIVRIIALFKVKENHLPFLQVKKGFGGRMNQSEFIKDSGGYMELYLTKPDYELFFEQYDVIDYKIMNGYVFNATKGLFNNFIDKFYAIKEEGAREKNPTKKLRGKTVMNSSYGKLGQRGHNRICHYEWDDKEILRIRTNKNEVDDSETIFVPAAAYCTSYARSYIVRLAQKNYDIFQYSDTDSMHLTGMPEGLWIDPYAMGAWDCEEDDIVKARYVRQKTYIEIRSDGSQILKACGLPEECKQQVIEKYGDKLIEKFDYGFVADGKLMRKKVKGGVILYNTQFAIKERK